MVHHGQDRHLKFQTLMSVTFTLLELIATTDSYAAADDQNQKEAMFYNIKTASLLGNVTMIKTVNDELDCAFMCLRNYPQNCLSFNFGGTSIDGKHTCELSNSERALEPHRMQSREGFDYFGVEKVYLSRYFPCLTSPCRNGGSCVNGPVLETFSCNCPLEIRKLPYDIDNKCTVDHGLVKVGSPVQNVFYVAVGKTQLNFDEAERLCEILGATLASLDQLTVAYQAGLKRCVWAWLIDATVRYPMQTVKPNCGNMIGIVGNEFPRDKSNEYDAWCHKG